MHGNALLSQSLAVLEYLELMNYCRVLFIATTPNLLVVRSMTLSHRCSYLWRQYGSPRRRILDLSC
jgi:hypothetical protein